MIPKGIETIPLPAQEDLYTVGVSGGQGGLGAVEQVVGYLERLPIFVGVVHEMNLDKLHEETEEEKTQDVPKRITVNV
jgi:hypothetical protein